MPVLEAMVIRVCGGAIVGGVKRSLFTSTIRAASGPIRYNPKVPDSAKPTRSREDATAGVSHSRPRWKQRAPTKTDQLWSLRETEKQKHEQDDAETADASTEMQRLKTEMQLRDSSTQSSTLSFSQQSLPVEEEEEEEEEEAVPAIARIPTFGNSGLFYGDGRKFEALNSKKNSSGLFYGDGRKFEIDDSNPKPSLFETVETEEDKAMAKEKQAAKNYALRLLGMAPQTAHKLRQKLIGRSVSAPVIESTIADLQRCGLQSDPEYAEAFARSRWRSALWGPQRLKQELKQRGVCPKDVAAALEKVFSGTEDSFHEEENEAEDEGDGAAWGMTRDARAHLMEKARLQWARGGSQVSAEARKRRMIGWLQRRGFNWTITSHILKSLESAKNNNNNKLVD